MLKFWQSENPDHEPTELEALSMRKSGLLSQRARIGTTPEQRADLSRQIEEIDRRRVELGVKPRYL